MKSQKGSSVLPGATIRIYLKVNISFWDCNHMLVYLNMIGFARILWSNWLNPAKKSLIVVAWSSCCCPEWSWSSSCMIWGIEAWQEKKNFEILTKPEEKCSPANPGWGSYCWRCCPSHCNRYRSCFHSRNLKAWKHYTSNSFTFQCPEIVLSLK